MYTITQCCVCMLCEIRMISIKASLGLVSFSERLTICSNVYEMITPNIIRTLTVNFVVLLLSLNANISLNIWPILMIRPLLERGSSPLSICGVFRDPCFGRPGPGRPRSCGDKRRTSKNTLFWSGALCASELGAVYRTAQSGEKLHQIDRGVIFVHNGVKIISVDAKISE